MSENEYDDEYAERKRKLAETMKSLGMTSISEEEFKETMMKNRQSGHIEYISQADYDYDFPENKEETH